SLFLANLFRRQPSVPRGPSQEGGHPVMDLARRILAGASNDRERRPPVIIVTVPVEGEQASSEQQLIVRCVHVTGVLDLLAVLDGLLPLVIAGHRDQGAS